mmetsp:Transcript_32561/g.103134  ORF Transcript_32561/g.103134 Transcript_32561/m.103134 type:complete len:85 (-) Transcript_32561:564-818(-)
MLGRCSTGRYELFSRRPGATKCFAFPARPTNFKPCPPYHCYSIITTTIVSVVVIVIVIVVIVIINIINIIIITTTTKPAHAAGL